MDRRSMCFGNSYFGHPLRPTLRCQESTIERRTSTSFETISIKRSPPGTASEYLMFPGRIEYSGASVKSLIRFGYGKTAAFGELADDQVLGGPGWINSEKFDITAKEEHSRTLELEKLPLVQKLDQTRLMAQSLLATRFHLKLRQETRERHQAHRQLGRFASKEPFDGCDQAWRRRLRRFDGDGQPRFT
jgi:Protein of unknown function (DUF3738)